MDSSDGNYDLLLQSTICDLQVRGLALQFAVCSAGFGMCDELVFRFTVVKEDFCIMYIKVPAAVLFLSFFAFTSAFDGLQSPVSKAQVVCKIPKLCNRQIDATNKNQDTAKRKTNKNMVYEKSERHRKRVHKRVWLCGRAAATTRDVVRDMRDANTLTRCTRGSDVVLKKRKKVGNAG
ncbi:hypothetical protein BCV70DRAFT_119226 [Testicularia cyperi]|uniref:Uncharacterized protein n=1 Tax=Testicularia cyperi TaxID=1882483 RepID=A0A317XQB1_9BASI|nr:hypothetical protein BCV70DRAFT_119226 [Testicularia cyperi]